MPSLAQLLAAYDPTCPLNRASTPPSAWYTTQRIAAAEQQCVFRRNWLIAGRVEQVAERGRYLALDLAGEAIVVVRNEGLKAFHNVCRHHAAQVMPDGEGCVRALHCPYHGWTYDLDGRLRSSPQFNGAINFDRSRFGLVPVQVDTWERWIFVCLDPQAPSLSDTLGAMKNRLRELELEKLHFHKRVSYAMNCNWKVFVDNYLDGGYHVPVLHRGLSSVLDNSNYAVEANDRFCVQKCPLSAPDSDAAVRRGAMAWYYWLYPNLMINCYEGVMDVNIVQPLGPERCRVDFDYYFAEQDASFIARSIAVAHQVQLEDAQISESVQQGLNSSSYDTGRLSPLKEVGEHLFHRLLHADLCRNACR